MPALLWTDALTVGHPDMDSQHRQLVALANALNEAMLQNSEEEVLRRQFAGLLSYTAMHFTSEERLMTETAYPAAAQHRKDHERLLLDLYHMRGNYRPRAQEILQTLSVLQAWLKDHIDSADRKLAEYLLQRRPG
jgi:hemerythrin-like metal-binding protein